MTRFKLDSGVPVSTKLPDKALAIWYSAMVSREIHGDNIDKNASFERLLLSTQLDSWSSQLMALLERTYGSSPYPDDSDVDFLDVDDDDYQQKCQNILFWIEARGGLTDLKIS